MEHLEELLQSSAVPCLVSLMMVNNEIGNLLNVSAVSALCKEHGALFHSDTVQGIGHVAFNLEDNPIDFIAASAHKFHGPKKRDVARDARVAIRALEDLFKEATPDEISRSEEHTSELQSR